MRRPGHFVAAICTIVAAALFLSGCGYNIAGRTGVMPGSVKSVSVPVFFNETRKPAIEGVVADAFASELSTTVEVPASGAEAALVGTVKKYELSAVSFTKGDVTQEYRLNVTLSVRLVKDSSTLWSVDALTYYKDFTADLDDTLRTRDREDEAFRSLAKALARIAKERMLTGY